MSKHIKRLKQFIYEHAGRDTHKPSEDNLGACTAAIEESIRNFFKGRKPSISPSQTGLTARQIWFIINDYTDYNKDKFKIETRFKMLVSSVAEHLAVFMMKEAGVPIENEQARLRVKIDHTDIEVGGSLDYEISEGVYDFKCTSEENYRDKFKSSQTLAETDPFGYCAQGELYGKGRGKEFKGWHVLNLNSGEIKFISSKDTKNCAQSQIEGLTNRINMAKMVDSYKDLPVCYQPWEDKNGVKWLDWRCARCDFVGRCFPDAVAAGTAGKPRYRLEDDS